MRKYPILYFKLLFIFSFILFLIFFDKINKMRIIIIFFFIFYFIFIKADPGANPHAINILDKIFVIMDNNSYFYSSSSSALSSGTFIETNLSFPLQYSNKNISKLNDSSFIITGYKNNALYFQIFNLSEQNINNLTNVINTGIGIPNYNLGYFSSNQFLISYPNGGNYYCTLFSINGMTLNNFTIDNYENAPFEYIKCLGYSSNGIVCLYLKNLNLVLKLFSLNTPNNAIIYNITNASLPDFNINNNNKIYLCYHIDINLYCDIIYVKNNIFNFEKKNLFIGLVYSSGTGQFNPSIFTFPQIIFKSNLVFIIYEEKSGDDVKFKVNVYFDNLDFVINSGSLAVNSEIEKYSIVIDSDYIINLYEDDNSVECRTMKLIKCSNKNILLSKNNSNESFILDDINSEKNFTIYNSNNNFSLRYSVGGSEINPKNEYSCKNKLDISYLNVSDSFDYYYSLRKNISFSLICNISIFSCYESCNECYTNKTGDNNIHNCKSCANTYYPFCTNKLNCLNNNSFPNGYYLNSSMNCYDKCHISCKNCTNSSSCDFCNDNYYKKEDQNNGLCYKNPLEYYYLNDNSTFSSCNNKCKNCFGREINQCTECITNYKIYNYFPYKCVVNIDNCPKWYLNNGELECNNSCPNNFMYSVENSSQCVSKGENIFNINATFFDESQNIKYYKYETDKKFYLNCPNGTNIINNECIVLDNKTFETKEVIIFNIFNRDIYFKDYIINYNLIDSYIEHRKNYSNIYNSSIDLVELYKGKDFQFIIYRYVNTKISELENFFELNNLIQIDFSNIFKGRRNLQSYEIIIAQTDALRDKDHTNQTEYEIYLYDGNNIMKMNLESDKIISIVYPLRNINEGINRIIYASKLGINVYDINSPFYSNICFIFTNEMKRDVTIKDRRIYYYLNSSFCENKCELITVDFENLKSICECKVKDFYSYQIIPSDYKEETLLKEVENINSIKCGNEVFKRNNLSSNYSIWFCLIIFILLLSNLLWYINIKTKNFEKFYNKILKFKDRNSINIQNENEFIINYRNQSINYPNPPKKSIGLNINDSKTTIEEEDITKRLNNNYMDDRNENEYRKNNYMIDDINYENIIDEKLKNEKIQNLKEENNIKNSQSSKKEDLNSSDSQHDEDKKKKLKKGNIQKNNIHDNVSDLNSSHRDLNFKKKNELMDSDIRKSLRLENSNNFNNNENNDINKNDNDDEIIDKLKKEKDMSFKGIFFRLFRKKEILLFPLTSPKDYIPFFISFSVFLLSANFIFLSYCLCFNNKNVHDRFLKNGNLGIKYFLQNEITNCIFSALITIVIKNIFNKFLIFSMFRINKKKISKENKNSFIKCTKIKIFIFYIIIFLLLIISSYINICYGGIFKNSIKSLLFGSLFTYIISLIICLFLCLLISLFKKFDLLTLYKVCRLIY